MRAADGPSTGRHRSTGLVRAIAIALLGWTAAACGEPVAGEGARAEPAPRVDRRIVLTFDDVPLVGAGECTPRAIDRVTDRLLATLASNDIPAAAFVVSGNACGPEPREVLARTLERWLDAGHELGNHTASHRDLDRVDLDWYEADIRRGAIVLDSLLRSRGGRLSYFRPPLLHMGSTPEKRWGIQRFLDENGYRLGPVTMDNQEWVYAAAYEVALGIGDSTLLERITASYLEHMEDVLAYYERLSDDVLGRDIPHIMLLHANRLNADHLDRLIGQIRSRGYRFVSLTEALDDPAYRLADDYVGPRGLSWLQRWALTMGRDVPPEPREAPWVARMTRPAPFRTYGFRWRRGDRWFDGRVEMLPGSPTSWGLLHLPGREGRTLLAVSRADTAGGDLVFSVPDPGGTLSVRRDASSGRPAAGVLVIREDTFRVRDFDERDAPPSDVALSLVGKDPVAPGVLSTDEAEEFPGFTPTGDTIYLTRRFRTILRSVRRQGRWSDLEPASFSGEFRDRAAEVSPDGTALYFTSNRPRPGERRRPDDRNHDLWRLRRTSGGGWGAPEPLPTTVNSDSADYHVSAARDHTLYFSSWSRPDGHGRSDLYRARPTADGYAPAENLGPVVNGPGSESDVFVDPDERFIIFVSTDRPDSHGGDDLYVSYRRADRWTSPRNLGPPVNSFAYEYGPTVSPDGRWLYFTSHRRGSADLYRVLLASVLEPARPAPDPDGGEQAAIRR